MSHLSLLDAARYAQASIPVFPVTYPLSRGEKRCCSCGRGDQCDAPAKHPRLTEWREHATTHKAWIDFWWMPGTRYARSNIGLVSGAASRIVVLDIDPRHGGDESLTGLETQYGPLPPTWRFMTGGGQHILFAHPDGYIKSVAGALGPGLDIKADGGYIIAPPSLHISGRRYTISLDHRPENVELAPPPDWLMGKLGAKSERSAAAIGRADWPAFAREPVPEGERNHRLTRLAGLLLRNLPDPELAGELVVAWNATHCNPPLGEQEVLNIIDSIASREAQRIRSGKNA